MTNKVWNILNKNNNDIVEALLENRGIKNIQQKDAFFTPTNPQDITLKEIGIDSTQIKNAIKRLKQAYKKKEKIIVYGDYDADGICSTAILWETLHKLKFDVMPYIPNRFDDGYGINKNTLEKLMSQNPDLGLIITVDNGIVAHEALKFAKEKNIDVIVTDHHTKDKKKLVANSIIHTTKTSGAGISWFVSREICKNFKTSFAPDLGLAAIGVVADQLPLLDINRCIAKFGITNLQKTKRVGLKMIYESAALLPSTIGVYEIGFVIAPRINAMGRLGDGTDSLRLLCTPNIDRAKDLSNLMNKTNTNRQKIVEEVITHAESFALVSNSQGAMLLVHESYHEGVIGLAASRLVEVYNRPAIVVAQGKEISKGSARSIAGVNITTVLREMEDLMINLGGHEMAAGFSIENRNLEELKSRLEKLTANLVTKELLIKKLEIDMLLDFEKINWELITKLQDFEPTGSGNPKPLFATKKVEILDKKLMGRNKEHLKLKIRKSEKIFDAIAFKMGELFEDIKATIDIAYHVEINTWNGVDSIQLRIRDIKTNL